MNNITVLSSSKEVNIEDYISIKMYESFVNHGDKIGLYTSEKEWAIAGITKRDRILRLRFWKALNEAVIQNKKVSIQKIISGIVKYDAFYDMLKKPTKAGFFFTRPLDFLIESELLLEIASERMLEILMLSQTDDRGKIIAPVLTAQIKVYSLVGDRVHGEAVQKIQQETRTQTVKIEKTKTIKELNAELEELEAIEAKVVKRD